MPARLGRDRTTYTVAAGRLTTPLDLGIGVRNSDIGKIVWSGGHSIRLNDPTFERHYRIWGDEPHRVQYALSTPLRRLLLDQFALGNSWIITDEGVSVFRHHHVNDGRWLYWAIEYAARAVDQLHRARAQVPTATALAHHYNDWHAFARAHNFAALHTPLCMWGEMRNVKVYVYSVRIGHRSFRLEIKAGFVGLLAAGIRLRPKYSSERADWFVDDHRLGNKRFDDIFQLKVHDPERARELLDAVLQQELLKLHDEIGPVYLDDNGLMVGIPYVPREPAMVLHALDRVVTVAERLKAKLVPPKRHGPYR